jgi:hypothetical protein
VRRVSLSVSNGISKTAERIVTKSDVEDMSCSSPTVQVGVAPACVRETLGLTVDQIIRWRPTPTKAKILSIYIIPNLLLSFFNVLLTVHHSDVKSVKQSHYRP